MKIVKVNYAYEIKRIVKLIRKLDRTQAMLNYVKKYEEKKLKEMGKTKQEAEAEEIEIAPPSRKKFFCIPKPYPSIGVLEGMCAKLESLIETEKEHLDVKSSKDMFVGTAFVTVNNQLHMEEIVNKFRTNFFRRVLNFFWFTIFRIKDNTIDHRVFDGNQLHVERAAEPADIFWENLGYRTLDRWKRGAITFLVTFLLLLVVFGVNLGLNLFKEWLEDTSRESDDSTGILIWLVRFISILTSFLVVTINVVLSRVVRKLTAKEVHATYTKYHLSVSFKLVAAMFINTALIPLFVNLGSKAYFIDWGLVMNIFYNSITYAFITPFFYFANIGHIIKKIKRCIEENKGENSKMTQRQANDLWTGPPLDMAQRYANTMTFFLIVLFYSFLSPILLLVGMFGIVWQYWLEKWVLLRRHKIPDVVGPTIAMFMANAVPYCLLIWSMGVFGLLAEVSDGGNWHGAWQMCLVILWLVVPFRLIIRLFSPKVERLDDESQFYENQHLNFFTDYDRQNPMTAKDALAEFLKEKAEKAESGEEKEEL